MPLSYVAFFDASVRSYNPSLVPAYTFSHFVIPSPALIDGTHALYLIIGKNGLPAWLGTLSTEPLHFRLFPPQTPPHDLARSPKTIGRW